MTSQRPLEPAAPPPWGIHEVGGADELQLRLGPLSIHLRSVDGEIHALHGHDEGTEPAWTRWAAARWDGRVQLTPVFPDRPLVVEPEMGFWLLRGAEARIYVRVPLWVHLEALGENRTSLLRIPTVPASDTWWGSLAEGELCYWLPTTARRGVEDSLFQPHLAMCPVQLVNGSADSLPVEKIALRVAYLSLFAHGHRIWADETRVRYQGDAEGSHLGVAGTAPAEAPGATRLAEPRLRMTRGFRALTFARIRSLQGWI
jgi:hypothetical protein